jgi:CheY-like chemotaxis protein
VGDDRRSLRILLAEDNPVNQMVAVRMLEKMGHTVMVVANGRDAVLMTEEHEFGLVLMDVQMPEMGGFEATRAIREKESFTHKHVPIVAMTAHAMKGDREQCLAVGMDGYVAKPIRPVDLAAEIERFARPFEQAPQIPRRPTGDKCIDWQDAWANLEGDRGLMSQLAHMFLNDLPLQMEAIHLAAEKKQGHDLESLTRRLRGSLGNFAAKPAFGAALQLEGIARRGDSEQIQPAMEALDREIERVQAALKDWTKKHDQNDLTDSPVILHLPPPSELGLPDDSTARL